MFSAAWRYTGSMGHEHERIEWNGDFWWFWTDYYKNRRGKLLHREKYIAEHGALPDGWHVHHIDGNKQNNDISNLEALPPGEHQHRHDPRGFVAWTTEQRANSSRHSWKIKKPTMRTCAVCGGNYESIGQRTKFCSIHCASVAHYAAHPKPKKGRTHLLKPPKPCVVCGKLFKKQDPRTICCSRECGYAYRRGDRSFG